MSKRILSVSYDENLLATRQMLLKSRGYAAADFDLFILGHSIPVSDKQELIKTFRNNCQAPILSLGRMGEERVSSDFHLVPDKPEELIETVNKIFEQK